jgi:glucan phosphorylase
MSTLMKSIADLINKEIDMFAKKVNEEFPQISINEMLTIWCEQQQICCFEIPSLYNDSDVNAEKKNLSTYIY